MVHYRRLLPSPPSLSSYVHYDENGNGKFQVTNDNRSAPEVAQEPGAGLAPGEEPSYRSIELLVNRSSRRRGQRNPTMGTGK